jgi:hypothetical protein
VGFELLQCLWRIINERETSGFSTTILCSESKDVDFRLVGLVELGELVSELVLGDIGSVGVEDVTINALDL